MAIPLDIISVKISHLFCFFNAESTNQRVDSISEPGPLNSDLQSAEDSSDEPAEQRPAGGVGSSEHADVAG